MLQTVALLNSGVAYSNAHRVDVHPEAASHFLKICGPFHLSFLSHFYWALKYTQECFPTT